jgi:hypothetical protein
MEELTVVLMFAAVATQVTTHLKNLTGGRVRAAVEGVIPWGVTFLVLLLGAEASATQGYVIPGLDQSLGDLDFASILLASAGIGSVGGFGYKTLTALDSSDSAAEPPIASGGAGDRTTPT